MVFQFPLFVTIDEKSAVTAFILYIMKYYEQNCERNSEAEREGVATVENVQSRWPRVGPPHRPNPTAGCVRWGRQPGYVIFGGQKIPLERPRVRTREGQEVELQSYGQLQQDGKLQRAVQERMVAGLSTRNYRRAVESVLEGYGIEKSSVSRQFVAASSNQLRVLCERRSEDLNLVVLMIE